MSDFKSELKAAWVGARQRAFQQNTRVIMAPEERQVLEEAFDRQLAEYDRQVAARAFAQGVEAALDTTNQHGLGLLTLIGNPYRKEQNNE